MLSDRAKVSESVNAAINDMHGYRAKIATASSPGKAATAAVSYQLFAHADVLMRCKSTDITIADIKFIARLTTNRNLHRIPTWYRR